MGMVVAKQKYCKGLYEDFGDCYLHLGVKNSKKILICYSPAGRSVLGETVPVVEAEGGTQTEGTVSPNTDRPRPVNNIFIFFLLRFKSFRKILLQPPTYVC